MASNRDRARSGHHTPGAIAPLTGYRADVQALRGLAVLGVVLYHAGLLSGGFVGVDVFFVISGFVIGRVLLKRLTSEQKPLRGFYARRAWRILPALAVTLAVIVLVSPLLAPIGARLVTSATGVASALFVANVYLYQATLGGYFADAADLNPLLHTWSLSVEEQFYLVIPACLLIAWRVGSRTPLTKMRVVVTVSILGSLAASLLFSYGGNVAQLNGLRFAFFSPVTRAWEFALGLALVVFPLRWYTTNWMRRAAMIVGVVLIVGSMVVYSDLTRFPGVAAAVPVMGTALAIYGGTRRDGPTEGAGHPALQPMIWLGDLSYSWYLWHWPLIVFAEAFWPNGGTWPLVVTGALSLLPAGLSSRFVEARFRGRAEGITVLRVSAVCIAAPLLAALVAIPLTAVVRGHNDVTLLEDGRRLHADEAQGCGDGTPIGERSPSRCVWGAEQTSPSVVLVGDSNAGQFSETFIGAAESDAISLRIATMSACPFIDADLVDAERQNGSCRRFVLRSMEHLVQVPPDAVVIANSTDFYLRSDRFDFSSDSDTEAARGAEFQAGLEKVIERLRSADIRVVVINVIPKPDEWDPGRCSPLAALIDLDRCLFPEFTPDEQDTQTAARQVEADATGRAGAELWNFDEEICPMGRCRPVKDGILVWRDSQHITVATAEALAPKVAGSLQTRITD
jgi:peptidoglycan/LPS O-acetylase OafA/YrhL